MILGNAFLAVVLGLGLTLVLYLKHEALFLGKIEEIDAGIPQTYVGPRIAFYPEFNRHPRRRRC